MTEEKEVDACGVETQEDKREERRFRHRVGYMAMMTCCITFLSFMFLMGWSVVVQGKDFAEGPAGKLLDTMSSVVGVIF